MSAQTRRRDCSTCKDPRKLPDSLAAKGIFACPTCNRKYERKNREGAAADRVLEGLLAVPEVRSHALGPPFASHSLDVSAGVSPGKAWEHRTADVPRGRSGGEGQ